VKKDENLIFKDFEFHQIISSNLIMIKKPIDEDSLSFNKKASISIKQDFNYA